MAVMERTLSENAKQIIVDGLTQALAETSVTMMKAQNFHWNVQGISFGPLHALFQEVYEDHFSGQDALAERIKALDAYAEGRYSSYLERSSITDTDGRISDRDMISTLQADQEQVAYTLRSLAEIAEGHGDVVTNDLAIQRADKHDKFAWMLRAHLR
jgi:starvation-inducible DNA-binding protein